MINGDKTTKIEDAYRLECFRKLHTLTIYTPHLVHTEIEILEIAKQFHSLNIRGKSHEFQFPPRTPHCNLFVLPLPSIDENDIHFKN